MDRSTVGKHQYNSFIRWLVVLVFIGAAPLLVWTVTTNQNEIRNMAAEPSACSPRPACLDANPACAVKAPAGTQFCPKTPIPTSRMCTMDANPCNPSSCNYNPSLCTTVTSTKPPISTLTTTVSPPCTPLPLCAYQTDPTAPTCKIGATPPSGGTWCQKPPITPSLTPPAGCFYQRVQCIQAPCNPILVCPSPSVSPISNTPTPTASSGIQKAGDFNDDGRVDIFDYKLLLAEFGKTGLRGFTRPDMNSDGIVNIFDYRLFLINFGT